MKIKIILGFLLTLLSTHFLLAQAPGAMNYQGIARDSKGKPLSQQKLSLKIMICTDPDGTQVEYSEIQEVLTNEFGLYTLQIGRGKSQVNQLNDVKWELGNKYIQVMIDPLGANQFQTAGTTQLLSVPYAFYADKAGEAKSTMPNQRAGTQNYLSKFNASGSSSAEINSQIYDNGTNIGIGTSTPATTAKVHVNVSSASVQELMRMQNQSATGAGRFTMYSDGAANYATFTKYGSNYTGSYAGLTTLYPLGNLLAFGNNGVTSGDGLGRFLISSGGNIGISLFKGGTSKLKFHADYFSENVGIGGNAAPSARLHLNNTDGNGFDLRITSNATGHTSSDGLEIKESGLDASIYNAEAGKMFFGTNGHVDMVIDTGGNFGIGTISPQTKMDINGQIKISGGSPGVGKVLTSDAVGLATWQTPPSGGGSNWVVNGTDLSNGNTGNVGIGTSTPAVKLDVAGQIKISGGSPGAGKVLTSSSTGVGTWEVPQTGHWALNGSDIYSSNTGKVGIGAITPDGKLHVAVSQTVIAPNINSSLVLENYGPHYLSMITNYSETGLLFANNINAADGGMIYNSSTLPSGLSFRCHKNQTRMVIDSSGRVGIGVASPLTRFHFRNGISNVTPITNSQLVVEHNFSNYFSLLHGSTSEAGIIFGNTTSSADGGIIFNGMTVQDGLQFRVNGNQTRMVIDSLGRVGIGTSTPGGLFELSLDQGRKPGTNTWTITSDARLKNIHGAYSKGLSEILQLKPIRYQYKNADQRTFSDEVLQTEYVGFSAQDVQQVFPESVGKDEDGYLNLNTHAILVAEINAIQELNKMIQEQKKEIELLKEQNRMLMEKMEKK